MPNRSRNDIQRALELEIQHFSRFTEPEPDELAWSPDPAPEVRFEDCPPLILEKRGITPQNRQQAADIIRREEQAEFWNRQTAFKNSIAAKLREVGELSKAETLEQCHTTYTLATCNDCGRAKRFPNRCDLFYCPECQPRLSNERKQQVAWWTHTIRQPKHVVLTVRNTETLTKEHVRQFRDAFTKLRRRKFARNWRGGFYSLEVTNEGRGWHLHMHALIDADWIDAPTLAIQWDNCTKHQGHIVKVIDAREKSYLAEVTKYAVKGSQLAEWQPHDIATFINTFDGLRTFGVFGDLYGARTEFAEFIASLKSAKTKCECGSCNIRYESEDAIRLQEFEPARQAPPRAPPTLQPSLALGLSEYLMPR